MELLYDFLFGTSDFQQAALPLIAAGGAILKGVGGIISAAKQKKAAQEQLKTLQSERVGALGQYDKMSEGVMTGYENYIQNLQNMQTFQRDTSGMDSLIGNLRDNVVGAGGGRVAGEELLREEARQSTANLLASARQGTSSGADYQTQLALGMLGERQQMRGIDAQTQSQRERQVQQAKDALNSGLLSQAQFDERMQKLEFESQQQKDMGIASSQLGMAERGAELTLGRMGVQKEYDAALAQQRGQIAMAKGEMFQQGFGMVGDAMSSYAGGEMQAEQTSALQANTNILNALKNFNPSSVTSDVRLKKNIKKKGKSPKGYNIYNFEYINPKFGEGVYQGVMAQELPEHITTLHEDGYYRVDYSKVDVDFKKV